MFPVSFFFFILKIIYKLYWNMAFERLTKFVLLYFIYVVYFWRTVIQPIFTYVKENSAMKKLKQDKKAWETSLFPMPPIKLSVLIYFRLRHSPDKLLLINILSSICHIREILVYINFGLHIERISFIICNIIPDSNTLYSRCIRV